MISAFYDFVKVRPYEGEDNYDDLMDSEIRKNSKMFKDDGVERL